MSKQYIYLSFTSEGRSLAISISAEREANDVIFSSTFKQSFLQDYIKLTKWGTQLMLMVIESGKEDIPKSTRA